MYYKESKQLAAAARGHESDGDKIGDPMERAGGQGETSKQFVTFGGPLGKPFVRVAVHCVIATTLRKCCHKPTIMNMSD